MARNKRKLKGIANQANGSPSKANLAVDQPNEFVETAFAQPLLLELIVDYAIRHKSGHLCTDSICNLRLVQTSWKQAVSKVLSTNKEPLYILYLNQTNSLNDTPYVRDNGKLLDQFVAFYLQSIEKGLPIPTFKLNISSCYFRLENYKSLLNCFQKCANGLVEIEMVVPPNLGSLPGIFPNIILPVLQKLDVTFNGTRLPNLTENELVLDNVANITLFYQSLLNQNDSLKELKFEATENGIFTLPGIQFTALPKTVTSVEINCVGVHDRELELLVNNQLPKLQSLTINLDSTPVSPTLLTNILEKSKSTLQTLIFVGNVYLGPPRQAHMIKFPVMEKLKTLEIHTIFIELETGIDSLSDTFPKLNKLVLYDQTEQMLEKWTSGSAIESVKDLSFELVDENKSQLLCNTLPMSVEGLQKVNITFPHITILCLQLAGKETSGLKYLFMEMRHVQQLFIYVTGSDVIDNSDHWDSVLIGAPIELVAGLSACPQYWNRVRLENEREPSIRMMSELFSFSLESIQSPDGLGTGLTTPLISDLSFVYALLKMPKLKNLILKGRFKASNAMTEKWMKRPGNSIKLT